MSFSVNIQGWNAPVTAEMGQTNLEVAIAQVVPTWRQTRLLHRAVAANFSDLIRYKAHLARPPSMVEALTELLLERGIRRIDIHADAFYTKAEKATLEGRT